MTYDEDYEYEEETDRSDSYSSVEEEEEEEEFEESAIDHHRYSQKEREMIEEWLKKNRPTEA